MKLSRPVLMLSGFLVLPVVLVPTTSLAQPSQRGNHVQMAPTPRSSPEGMLLLRQSLAAIRDTLRTDHGSQISTIKDPTQHQSGTIQYSGDCALAGATLRVRVTESARFSQRPPTTTSFVVIASMTASHTWTRSAPSHKTWSQVDFAQIGGEMLMVCPSLYLRQFLDERLTNEGLATTEGHVTWHLHARQASHGETNTQDFYLDRATLYPVRLVLDQKRASSHFHVLTRYSLLNTPMVISEPRSNEPLPPLTGGLSVVVTPNPMPGGATPTVTITTAPGARCTPRVAYAMPARTTRAITKQLGTQTVGTTGTVQWHLIVPKQAVGGNAMVDCSRGRATTNQVASFFIFS